MNFCACRQQQPQSVEFGQAQRRGLERRCFREIGDAADRRRHIRREGNLHDGLFAIGGVK
jgi:hypothetical protein